MFHLALVDKLLHCAGYFFNRNVQIDAMLIEQIDGIDFEPLERCLSDLLDVLRPAVQRTPLAAILGIRLPAKLGSDHHTAAKWSERFTYQFFVQQGAVHLGGVEERDASLDSGMQ